MKNQTGFTLPLSLRKHITNPELIEEFNRAEKWNRDTVAVSFSDMSDDALADVQNAADQTKDKHLSAVAGAIIAARADKADRTIPHLGAAPGVLTAYLRENMIDGWVYVRGNHGHLVPALVTDIEVVDSGYKNEKPVLSIEMYQAGTFKDSGGQTHITLEPGKVTKRKPATVMETAGLLLETPALKAEYEQTLNRYRDVLGDFAHQFKFTGTPLAPRNSWGHGLPNRVTDHKVIHDLAPTDLQTPDEVRQSILTVPATTPPHHREVTAAPVNPVVRVFDLAIHQFYEVHVDDLTKYEWDDTLREKIILPEDQRELLDILTSDLGTFSSDLIEGKSAGSTIVCKGEPGVGKTLSAEVFSEVVHRPLYSIHSGSLGATAKDVRENLEAVFQRAKRWNAVLLLDEADVFVLERKENLTQNAIVAEFLRTMEYFDGLMFMTTNRADDIDDAILSRAVAVIHYHTPEGEDLDRSWQVLADAVGVPLTGTVRAEVVAGFGSIAQRDIKMLLALAGRVSAAKGEPITADLFRRCAMFRGLTWKGDAE